MNSKSIKYFLLGLIALDLLLSIVSFFAPELWFRVFHGVFYVDPQGLLRRCAATWAAFALFQILAYFKWRQKPYWLVLVAGLRFSDVFTDWTYYYFAQNLTDFGRMSLIVASPVNFFMGRFFLKQFLLAKEISSSP